MRTFLVLGLLLASAQADEIAALVAATKDPERGVRYAAVQALGKAGQGVEALVAALDDPEWCVRQAAGHSLARVRGPAVDALLKVAKEGKPDARVEAYEALRRMGWRCGPHVIPALEDEDARVVFEGLTGIWVVGDKNLPLVPRITPHLTSSDPKVRVMAHFALVAVNPEARPAVRNGIGALRAFTARDPWAKRWTERLSSSLEPEAPEPQLSIDLEKLGDDVPGWRLDVLDAARVGRRRFYDQREAVAKLLYAEDDGVVRDAAMVMELVGADPRPILVERGVWNALLYCEPLTGEAIKPLLDGAEVLPEASDLRDWAMVVGRAGADATAAEVSLRRLTHYADEEVRAAAVWALGRIGKPLVAPLGDRSAAVRAIAARFVVDVDRLRAIARGRDREAARLALLRLGELGILDAPRAALEHPDPLLRITAVQALGARTPTPMAKDPERDVRIAVARARAIASQLVDPNWRVRLASIRSHGRARTGAEQLAPFLADKNLALSAAASEALQRCGPAAAVPVARLLARGDEAIWHYAPKLFGEDCAAAVPHLIPVLRHPNPTARETAARCLAAVGPAAKAASAELVRALGDRRLPVVSHAALALGRIGITDELRAALRSKRARVRAYAAFAIGWALGSAREIDQVAYEPRMPVLDSGEPDPGVTREQVENLDALPALEAVRLCLRGIWSKDPRVAYPCASRLEHDQKSPLECERTTELVIAEGFRKGHRFEVGNFRYALGSNELPAALEFMMYPRDPEWQRPELYGELHRSPRSDNIPALCWFLRSEDPIRLEGFDNFDMPYSNTNRYREELTRMWLGREGSVWELVDKIGTLPTPLRWWLETDPIPAVEEHSLVEIVARSRGQERSGGNRLAALRALSRGRESATEPFLRRVALEGGTVGHAAQAALARRGDPLALVRLLRASRRQNDAFCLLVEMLPAAAASVLRDRLSNPATAAATASHCADWQEEWSYLLGAEWSMEPFLGLEPSLIPGVLEFDALAAIALHVPGCRTRRAATALMERAESGALDRTEFDPNVAGLLASVTPKRLHSLLIGWIKSDDDEAVASGFKLLLRQGDEADAPSLLPLLDEYGVHDSLFHLNPWVRKGVEAQMRRNGKLSKQYERMKLLELQCGFSFMPSELGPDPWLSVDEWKLLHAAASAGNGARAARELLQRRVDLRWESEDPVRSRNWDWMRQELTRRYEAREYANADHHLGKLASWPVPEARAEYWSALRAGRYWWIGGWEETYSFTLGYDFATLPHWRTELESNCCRVSGRLEWTFRSLFGIDSLNDCANYGVGEPGSDRVLDWFELFGGDLEWSPLARRFLPRPE